MHRVLYEQEPNYSPVVAEACTHALILVHTLQHSPPEVTGPGGKREGAAWKGMTVETNTTTTTPASPLLRTLSSSPGSRPARLLGRPGRGRPWRLSAGWGPAELAAPLEPGRGLGAGRRAGYARGKAPQSQPLARASVNDLITRLGRLNCAGPSLAPPPPCSAPSRRYKTAPACGPSPRAPLQAGEYPAGRAGRERQPGWEPGWRASWEKTQAEPETGGGVLSPNSNQIPCVSRRDTAAWALEVFFYPLGE